MLHALHLGLEFPPSDQACGSAVRHAGPWSTPVSVDMF